MTTTVIDNAGQPLGELLDSELRSADEFLAASAFLNSNGLNVIEDNLWRILENEGRVTVIHGADFRITDPDAVRVLADMKSGFYATMSYYVHLDWSLLHRQRFHPKLYITTSDYENYCAIVGSSNLTLGGLSDNAEVNAVIRGRRADAPIRRCLDIYESMRANPALREPTAEFANAYASLYEQVKALPLSDAPPPDLAGLYEELAAPQPIPETRAPRTQLDYAARAVANLTCNDTRQYVHLSSIYAEAERLARNAGSLYKWETFGNSIRRSINENVEGRRRGLFTRREEHSGEYRLSERGWAYANRLSG